jgi:uncharacterized membrane protein HdeD (DUF308 family)
MAGAIIFGVIALVVGGFGTTRALRMRRSGQAWRSMQPTA